MDMGLLRYFGIFIFGSILSILVWWYENTWYGGF